jgi:hypothetical protein
VIGGMLVAPATVGLLGLTPGSETASAGDALASWGLLERRMGPERLAVAGILVGIGSRVSPTRCLAFQN